LPEISFRALLIREGPFFAPRAQLVFRPARVHRAVFWGESGKVRFRG
jgi:hypothetical protein